MSEKLSTGFNVWGLDEVRQASKDIGMCAGGLSLAFLGVSPETLDQHASQPAIVTPVFSEEYEIIPTIPYLESLSRAQASAQLSRVSMQGAVESFTKADLS